MSGKVSKSKLHFPSLVISVLKIVLNFMLFSLNFGGEERFFMEDIVNVGYRPCNEYLAHAMLSFGVKLSFLIKIRYSASKVEV